MPDEIERKFIAKIDFDYFPIDSSRRRQQVYISKEPEVRVSWYMNNLNIVPNSYNLAVKSGHGIKRLETDFGIDDKHGSEIAGLVPETHVIDKIRYESGPWEVDIFAYPLSPLVIAEIEFETEDTTLPGIPRGLTLLKEVTEDVRFHNVNLAGLSNSQLQDLLGTVGLLDITSVSHSENDKSLVAHGNL